MNINLEVRIIASNQRLEYGERILAELKTGKLYVDEEQRGAKANHFKALSTPAGEDTTHLLIVEEDAWPVKDWEDKAKQVISLYPDSLVSLYLGTGRPVQWQRKVDEYLKTNPLTEYLNFTTLFHGVSYCIPTGVINLEEAYSNPNSIKTKEADYAVGEVWLEEAQQEEIIYSRLSVFEHLDIAPTLPDSRRYIERKARSLWN